MYIRKVVLSAWVVSAGFFTYATAQDLTLLDLTPLKSDFHQTDDFQLDFYDMSSHKLYDGNKTVHSLRVIEESVRNNPHFNSGIYLFVGGSSEALRIKPDALLSPNYSKLKYGAFVTSGDSQIGLGYDLHDDVAITLSYFVRGNSYENISFDENIAAISLTLR